MRIGLQPKVKHPLLRLHNGATGDETEDAIRAATTDVTKASARTRRTQEIGMAHTTIEQFASELRMPAGALLEQLSAAGVEVKKEGTIFNVTPTVQS